MPLKTQKNRVHLPARGFARARPLPRSADPPLAPAPRFRPELGRGFAVGAGFFAKEEEEVGRLDIKDVSVVLIRKVKPGKGGDLWGGEAGLT